MTVTLPSDVQIFIEEQIAAGRFSTVEEVLRAGVFSLTLPHDDFAPGELEAIIAHAEKSYREEGGIPAKEVFDRIRDMSAKAREQAK